MRVYVVTIAPQVSGNIVQLPIVDDQVVHKGDLLMEIDPTNYKIAVDVAEAAVAQAKATYDNANASRSDGRSSGNGPPRKKRKSS